MSNTVLGVPISINIKEPNKKEKVIKLLNELKSISDDSFLTSLVNTALKALGVPVQKVQPQTSFYNATLQAAQAIGNLTNFFNGEQKTERHNKHKLDNYKDVITNYVQENLTYKQICHKLYNEHGVNETYQNVRYYIQKKILR